MTRRFLKVVLAVAGVFACATPAEAQEVQVTGPLAGAPAVRKLRLHRKGRLELAPTASFTLLDEYQRTILVGARLNYNFTDWLAFGVWGAFGAVKSTTGLSDKIQGVIDQRYNPNSPGYKDPAQQVQRRLTSVNLGKDFKSQLGTINWVVAPQITAVPFRGKLAIFQSIFVDTDAYLFAGPAFIGLQEREDCGGGTHIDCTSLVKNTTTRMAIAPTFGLGLSFYMGKWTSLGLEWRGLPFAWNTGGFDTRGGGQDERFPDNKIDAKDHQFKFNQMISVSFGIYLPTEMNTSE